MVLLKLGSKKTEEKKPVPDTLPELPTHHDAPSQNVAIDNEIKKAPETLPELKREEQSQPQQQGTTQQEVAQTNQSQPQQATIQQQPQIDQSQPQQAIMQPQAQTNQSQPQQAIMQPQAQTNQSQPPQATQQATMQPQAQTNQSQPPQATQQATMQPQAQTTTQENSSPILSNSYFTRFEKLIKEETNIDSLANKLDEFSKKDIFTNLKDFHESYDEGKAFLIHKDEFRDLLNQKINYLKTLETEWHDKKEKLEELKKEVKTKEERLIFEVDELKHLMNQIKSQEIGDRYFHTYDGKTLKSIKELKAFLQETTQEIFEYHVNEQKNDFANWIEHVFQIKDLSNKIKYIKNKEEMIKQL